MGARVPNPSINPESAINYEIGATFNYASTNATIAVFYNDLIKTFGSIDMPDGTCIAGTECYQNVNARGGYMYGVEVGLKQGFWADRISLGLNYAWTTRWIPGGLKSLGYPPHMGNITFAITPIKQFDFIAMATYQSRVFKDTAAGIDYLNSDVFLVDLKMNYRIMDNLELSVGAYNLLDRGYYYTSSSMYYPGRRFFTSLEYKF